MEALQRGKRRRGDWTLAALADKRTAALTTGCDVPHDHHDNSGSGGGAWAGPARTPVAPSALGRPSPVTSPLDEPLPAQPVQPGTEFADTVVADDEDNFELSLSEDSEDEAQARGGSAALSDMSPTVAEASAFVAAAVAASPGVQTESNTDAAATTTGSQSDAAARLAALLEKRPKLKVVKKTKNKLSGRELAGLSDDEEEAGGDGTEAAKAVADEIRQRREARLQARQSMSAEVAARGDQGLSNSPVPLTIDLT